jgi:hypothetical protein
MRTITLLQNRQKAWYVHTTSGRETISTQEQYGKPNQPSSAQRAFLTEGRHQPYAKMVVIVDGKRIVIRRASAVPAHDSSWLVDALLKLRAAMRVRKTH